jgi:hypothetical protein
MTAYDINYRYLKDLIEEAQDKAFDDMCNGTFQEWESYSDYHDELLQELTVVYGLNYSLSSVDMFDLGVELNEVFTDFYKEACVFVVSQNQDYFIKKYIKYEFVLLDNNNE